MAKIIYNTQTQGFQPYPRQDDEPVVGLAPHLHVYDVVVDPHPAYDANTQHLVAHEVRDYENKILRTTWQVRDTPVEAKAWPSVTELWAEFTPEEQLQIINSDNAHVRLMHETMRTWTYRFLADDPRVLDGLNLLESTGILTPERKAVILTA